MGRLIVCIDISAFAEIKNDCLIIEEENIHSILRLLKSIHETSIYLIVQNPFLSEAGFSVNEEKMKFLIEELIDGMRSRGAVLHYFICSHVSPAFAARYPEKKFLPEKISECSCIKPNIGIIEEVLVNEKLAKEEVTIYGIGTTLIDIQTFLNGGAYGIFIPNKKDPENEWEEQKIRDLNSKNKYLAESFPAAISYILSKYQRSID